MDQAQTIGIAIGIGVPLLLLAIVFLKTNTIICHPNELVVLSGLERKLPDGSVAGYRVLRGGYGFKRPFRESVARLSLTALPVDLHLKKVMCEGMIPVSVEGRANVKLAGSAEDGMDAAIERFLGKGPDAVAKAARQSIEGALRGVLATKDPAEANARRLELTTAAVEQARADLRELGIVLDYLQIHELYDEQGYLEAIGRKRNAEVQRDARVAEATAEAEARKVAAEQQRLGREAEIAAELGVLEKENALSVRRAELDASARQAEERSKVAGRIARAEEEITLEDKRKELVETREQADTVIPARAAREAAQLKAQGEAARILEDGRATSEALELMREQWAEGENKDLFLIHLFPELLDKATRVIADNLRIDKLTVLDGGSGQGLPNAVRNLTDSAAVMVEQVKTATGIDLPRMARSLEAEDTSTALPKDLD